MLSALVNPVAEQAAQREGEIEAIVGHNLHNTGIKVKIVL